MPDQEVSCTQSARGPLITQAAHGNGSESVSPSEEVPPMVLARVGKAAPDFEAMAYHAGKFKLVKLSDFDGEWRLVCFYPGDFTFV